jgi:hypothetical protein
MTYNCIQAIKLDLIGICILSSDAKQNSRSEMSAGIRIHSTFHHCIVAEIFVDKGRNYLSRIYSTDVGHRITIVTALQKAESASAFLVIPPSPISHHNHLFLHLVLLSSVSHTPTAFLSHLSFKSFQPLIRHIAKMQRFEEVYLPPDPVFPEGLAELG